MTLEVSTIKTTKDELTKNMDNLNKELASMKSTNEELSSKYNALETEKQDLVTKQGSLDKELGDHENTKSQLKDITTKLLALEGVHKLLTRDHGNLNDELVSIKELKSNNESELEKI